MSRLNKSRLQMAASTDRGARDGNEDDLRHGSSPAGHYAVLADGAGGHARGEEASRIAVERIQRGLCESTSVFLPERLTQLVRLAHDDLRQQHTGGHPQASMHTTVVVLWVDPPARKVLWTHVGDSRLYRFRHGRAELLTLDDSVVQQMVQAGLISAEQSRQHPQKNHLVAALGIDGDVEPHTVPRAVHLLEGDAYLLCSDGWWDHFEPEQMDEALALAASPEHWLQAMRAEVLAHAQPQQDNFSAIAVWVGNPGEMTVARFEDTLPRGVRRR